MSTQTNFGTQHAPSSNQNGGDERFKTQAYANAYVSLGGKRIKLGAAPINTKNADLAKIVARLKEDPESAARLSAMVEIVINLANTGDDGAVIEF